MGTTTWKNWSSPYYCSFKYISLYDVFDKFCYDFLWIKLLARPDKAFAYTRHEAQGQTMMFGGYSPLDSLLNSVVAMISKAFVYRSIDKDGLICLYCKTS